MPSSIVHYRGDRYMYYTGWSKAVTVPFSFHIGLAIGEGVDGSFRRYSKAPVIGRNHHDPYIVGAPFVILDGDKFRMWYISCTGWVIEDGQDKPKHYYTVKHAESSDGITWETEEQLCLDYEDDEYAIARPTVTVDDGVFTMLYTYRGGDETYRMATATSTDGRTWSRQGPLRGLEPSPDGWDSEMVCYGAVLSHSATRLMLYNGNSYGATGVGLANWVY
ncbi:MAG: hypothetical protein HN796_19015 [Gemmatimonadetes bacterium]|nr:hypothetical protein [Gemmatimonadota bacterium]